MNCKARFLVKNCFNIVCQMYSFIPFQQSHHRDISEENVTYGPPHGDQRVYDFAQDKAPDFNLYAVVNKYPRQAPVEPNQSHENQAFNEMPTSSGVDSTQHYAVINKAHKHEKRPGIR